MSNPRSNCLSEVEDEPLNARLAAIYGTSQRQICRWVEARMPILVAARMRTRLQYQNNPGEVGDRLARSGEVERIQAELDRLHGEDLAASAQVFDHALAIDKRVSLLSQAVKSSRLSQKREWLAVCRALEKANRAGDNLRLTGPALDVPYREVSGEPEDVS